MGDLIASGNGKKYKAYVIFEAIMLIISLLTAAWLFTEAEGGTSSYYGFTYKTKDTTMYTVGGFLMFVLMMLSIFQVIRYAIMSGTKIEVYKDHVIGKGMVAKLNASSFKLTYDKISNVDTGKDFITVYTKHGVKYICYVGLPYTISEAIEEQAKGSK